MLYGEKRRRIPLLWDVDNPMMSGLVQNQDAYMQSVAAQRPFFFDHVRELTDRASREYGDLTGRRYDRVMTYRADDADYLIVGQGIGRTGRAGAAGVAISFASPADSDYLRQIERYLGHSLSRHVIPGLEPRLNPRTDAGRARRPSLGFRRPHSGPGVSTPSFYDGRRDRNAADGGYAARNKREWKREGGRSGDFRREPLGSGKRWA